MEAHDLIILEDAVRIVKEAAKRGLYLRLLGAIGIKVNASHHDDLFNRLDRLASEKKFTDIDFAAYSDQRGRVRGLLESLGYQVNQHALLLHGNTRMLFHHPAKEYITDVFFDKLEFSHAVHFGKSPQKGRLHLNPLTVSPTDLLLEKVQIHQINEKDIKDLILLLTANVVADSEGPNTVNGKYVATLFSDDWEFWYEATINLQKTLQFLERYVKEKLVGEEVRATVSARVQDLLRFINSEPKTKRWEKRNKDGPKKRWWRDVEERSR